MPSVSQNSNRPAAYLSFKRPTKDYFVYGGDVFDKGDDFTVAHLLADLKDKYPGKSLNNNNTNNVSGFI